MTKKRKITRAPNPAPQYTLTGCTFHGASASPEAVGVATAIARAAEANAVALQKAADMLRGPDALLKIGS